VAAGQGLSAQCSYDDIGASNQLKAYAGELGTAKVRLHLCFFGQGRIYMLIWKVGGDRAMAAKQFADRLGNIDDKLVQQASDSLRVEVKKRKWRRLISLTVAILVILAICGFAAYKLGVSDLWIQKPSPDPVETVQSAIKNQADKDYASMARVDEVAIDEAETARKIEAYTGSDLAAARGWSNEYLQEHFIAIRAKYYVEYDHTKTFLEDGSIDQYFYLVEDTRSGKWTIIDNSTNGEPLRNTEEQ
jgi:hypothetical protein